MTTVLWGTEKRGKAAIYKGAGVQAFCVKQGQSESACKTGWLKKPGEDLFRGRISGCSKETAAPFFL